MPTFSPGAPPLKRRLPHLLCTVLCIAAPASFAARTFAQTITPVDATVCQITAHPKQFDGKIVRVKGIVQVGFNSFQMRGDSCTSALWLSYPAGTHAKSGPAAVVTLQLASGSTGTPGTSRPALTLSRTKDFDTFDSLLSQKVKTPGMCLACVKNDVIATVTGRIDGTDDPGLTRDAAGKITALDGFGNMNLYGARLVIQSVADVSAKEINFSKIEKVKEDSQGSNDKDFAKLINKTEESFPKGTPAVAQIQRALDAFGASGVSNGVIISFSGANEVPAGEGTRSTTASPDGLLLTIALDPDRLKGEALSRAIAHTGSEVADLREGKLISYTAIENESWQTTLLVTIGARQKSLTVPGGVVLWTEAWPAAERNNNATAALSNYLVEHEQTGR